MIRLFGFLLIVISISLGWSWMSYQQSVNSSYISDETGAVVITINKGDALNKVVEKLSAKGAVEAKWFKWLVRLEGQANKIQAGEYEFSPGLTPVQILQFLVKGKVNQYAVSLIEGQTFKQILNDLHEHPAIENTLPIKADMATYLTLLNFSEKHLEGLLLPETYFFIKGTSDVEIITRAYRSMQAFINTAWLERQQNKDIKTVYDALILASIVEKETAVASERKRIAGLFLRRLEIGMKLQTDPTVIYGMGDIYQGDIRFRDLRKDTPYNTYTRYGLPPTPIAMPGKASIDAVLHPEKTRSLYFVSKGNGTHVFSETLRQHNNAVNKYQRKNKK